MAASASILMVGSTVAGAVTQSQAAKMQGDYAKAQGDLNASLSQEAGRDAIARGDREASIQYTKTRQLIAAQRAAAGATGGDVGSGSNLDVQDQSKAMGALDMMTIKNNAVREAYGYRVQAINQESQGRLAQLAGDTEARNTLLVGGLKAAAYGLDGFAKPKPVDTGPSKASFMTGSRPTPRITNEGY